MSKARYTVADFEPHIPGSGGIISTIAKRVGCEWNTARKRIDESPKLTEMYNAEREGILDMAESVILQSIKAGDTQDAKWVLSRLGKGRGFADKVETEVTGQDGGAIRVVIEYADPDA